MRVALVIVAGLAGVARADCPENTPKAACMLHEEAVELLTAGKFEDAATKFRAAIAASASARSYLGYSQAVEGAGKIALAYETMLVAQRLSNEEMAASGGKDAQVVGRAERIKYKLSELGGRVGFVWLRVPEGVPPQRLVSVHREREGDLPSPLGRWVTVAPNRQVLIAALDDGTQLEVIAAVAPGAQTSLVIPIAAANRPPLPQPVPGPAQPPPGMGRPITQLYQQPVPPPTPPMPVAMFAVGLTVLSPGPGSLSTGTGLTALFERKLGASPVGLSTRLDYVFHPSDTDFSSDVTTSGSDVLLMAGLRTMSRTIHARAETGFDIITIDLDNLAGDTVSDTSAHPCFALGGGLTFGRFRVHAGALWTFSEGDVETRFMATLGLDLYRK